MKKHLALYLAAAAASLAVCSCRENPVSLGLHLEESMLPPMPEVQTPVKLASSSLGNCDSFEEVQLDMPIIEGPFEPSWESIEKNYPGTPDWLREAKIGFWVCFGPQSAGHSGDWYARRLYQQDNDAYRNHLERFGHPSEVGYKDVLNSWNPDKLDPEKLTRLYQRAGARFLMIMGVHHDNYDLWNSKFQPWNSVNVGPKRDLLREWADACRDNGMHYGVTFHHEYTWWWWQTAFSSDSEGEKAGVPYDGCLTLEDGKGKWWEGLDPRRLYGIDLREYSEVNDLVKTRIPLVESGIFSNHLDYADWYARQWALRMMDVCENYDPDFIYTDGTDQGPFSGHGTGYGYKCNAMPTVMADYYNRQLLNKGKVDAFSIVKFRKPTNGTVNTAEFDFPDSINVSQPWIRETAIGDWYYAPGFIYDPGSVVRFFIESVCRDGNVALNIPILPDGSIEDACVTMLEQVGQWMDINGEAIYGSKAWKTLGEGEIVNGKLKTLPGGHLGENQVKFKFNARDIRFTEGKKGDIYAFTMNVPEPGQTVRISSMGLESGNIGKVQKVTLLGYKGKINWKQLGDALEITYPDDVKLNYSAVFKID